MTNNYSKTLWTLTIYSALSFFVLGVSAMTHYFIYPAFDKVHENIATFMDVFNSRIIFLFYIPSILLLISSISLFWFAPINFPKWTIIASTVLSAISVTTIFFVLNPIHTSFSQTSGFETTQFNKLLSNSFNFQLIPIILQVILTFWLINIFVTNVKPFSKLIFILIFASAFFTAGSDFTEKFLNYPLWLTVGANEWFSFREVIHTKAFLLVYLIPAFLPLLLLLLMIWFRPIVIKRKYIFIYLGLYVFISAITSAYFVPKLQLPLDKEYSTTLIEKLIKMDLPLRLLPSLLIYGLATFIFMKVGQDQFQKAK